MDDLTIGELLSLVQGDFPEASIGRIRTFEDAGLIHSTRSESGNRRYSPDTVGTLRTLLARQRDRADRSSRPTLFDVPADSVPAGAADPPAPPAADPPVAPPAGSTTPPAAGSRGPSGSEPAARAVADSPEALSEHGPAVSPIGSPAPGAGISATGDTSVTFDTPTGQVPAIAVDQDRSRRREAASVVSELQEGPSAGTRETRQSPTRARDPEPGSDLAALLTREQFRDEVGLDEALLSTMEDYGVVSPVVVQGVSHYDSGAVRVGALVARFAELGLEARHLRMFRVAAERETSLLEQLTLPLIKQRNPIGREEARRRLEEAAELSTRLHSALLQEGINRLLNR